MSIARSPRGVRPDPQRVFFAAGLASGALGVSVWLLYALAPGLAPSSSAHMGLMLQGFGFCFAWAVLAVLVPARLRAPPVPRGAHALVLAGVLGAVVGLWLDAHQLAEPAFALAAVAAFGAAASRVPRRDRPLDATAAIGLLALLAAVLGAALRIGYVFDLIGTDAALVGRRFLSEGMLMLLMLALSARAIPVVLGRRPRRGLWPSILAALALLLIVPLEHGLEWGALRFVRAGIVALVLLRDVPLSTWPDRGPAAFGVFIAHRMIALGGVVAAIAPGPASDALHLVFIGGYSILLFAFSAPPGALAGAVWTAVVSLAVAMIARVGAPFTTEGYMTHLAYASACWLVALLAQLLVVRGRRAPTAARVQPPPRESRASNLRALVEGPR